MTIPGAKYQQALARNRIADAETMAIRLMVDLIVNAAKEQDGLNLKLTQDEAARVSHIVQRLDAAAEQARQVLGCTD